MIPKKPAPDLIRGVQRFSEKIMLKARSWSGMMIQGKVIPLQLAPITQPLPTARIAIDPRADASDSAEAIAVDARAAKVHIPDAAGQPIQPMQWRR
jgi:hypothetical protein